MNAYDIPRVSRRLAIVLATIGGSLVALRAGAQSTSTTAPSTSKPIDLQTAVGIALRQNVAVRQSENAVASNAAVVSGRQGALLPSLSLSTSTAQSIGRASTTAIGAASSTQSMNAGLTSSFVVFDGLHNINQLRQARLDVSASTSDLTRTKQTVVFTVASDYLTLATAEGLAGVQRENLAALEAEETQLQKLVKAGARSISDLYQQQANTASARAGVVSAERDVELAKIAVIQTLQLDPRGTYDFVSPQVNDATTARHYDLDSLLNRAFASRSDLAAEQTRVDASALGTKAAQASRLPSVSVSTSYNATYNSAGTATLADQFNQNRGGSVSLGVTFPIFDRGTTTAAVQQARLQEEDARLSLANQRQAIALDVRRAYLTLESTRQQLAVALAQQKAADLAVSTTKARYAVGTSTLLELTQARASQLQAATSVVNARNALAFQDALIPYYTGELDPTAAVLPQ